MMNQGGIAAAIILPGAVVHFFCGATAGVCGNATGGLKGCVAGAFVHGIMVTSIAAALLPVLGNPGFANTTFSDADFTVVGIIFGNFAKAFGGSILFGLIVVLFAAPIVYNFVAPKPKKASEEVAEQG